MTDARSLLLFSRHARGRSYDLGKMDFRGLVGAFFTYPTVLLYLGLSAAAGYGAVRYGILRMPVQAIGLGILTFLVYAVVWYVLHRWVLHSTLLFRSPLTARLFKRVHYDHHQDPHQMAVLFGSPATTLPTIVAITWPMGWAVAGTAGSFCAVFAGVTITLFYEFSHCCCHLNYTPRQAWLVRVKRLHMAHHFHNEVGNYGIVSFWPDRLLGTLHEDPSTQPRSPTVLNIGYDEEAADRYPWVAALSASAAAKTGKPD